MTTHFVLLRAQKHKQFFTALIISCLTVLLAVPATFPTATADPTPSTSPYITNVQFYWDSPSNGDRIDGNHLLLTPRGYITTEARLEFDLATNSDYTQYPVGALKIEVPFKIWEDRYGAKTGGVKIPSSIPLKDPNNPVNTDYVYYIKDGNTLVIENNRAINTGGRGVVSFAFSISDNGTYTDLHNYVDTTVSDPIQATITITNPPTAAEPIGTHVTGSLDAQIDTEARYGSYVRSNFLQKNSDKDLFFSIYTNTYRGDYDSQPAYFEHLTVQLDPSSYIGSVNLTDSVVITGARDVTGQNVRVTIADDGRSVSAQCIDDEGNNARCTNPIKLEIDAMIPHDAPGYNASATSGTVGFGFREEQNVIPADGFDDEYTLRDASYGQHSWQDEEIPDDLFEDVFFGHGKGGGSVTQEGEYQGKWKLSELKDGHNLFWGFQSLANYMNNGQVITRGAFPTLQSFTNNGGVWTATVTNTADYPSRLATVEIPLPEGAEVDTSSLVFKLGGQDVEASYTYENGILAVQTPNIPADGNFTASFSLTEGSSVSATAGSLNVQQLEPVFNPQSSATANRASRTDIFTVTNNGTATTPAGIPLELNRLQCGPSSYYSVWGCFASDVHSYQAFLNGSPLDMDTVNNYTSPRSYSHAVYLPELAPGDTFRYEVTVFDYPAYRSSNNPLEASQYFRAKLGQVSAVNVQNTPDPSQHLYALISDLSKDNALNYGLRPIVGENIDTAMYASANLNGTGAKLTPGEDYEITAVSFHSAVSMDRFEVNPSGQFVPEDTPQTVTVWGRATENDEWVKYAEVTYSYVMAYIPSFGTNYRWFISDIKYMNGAEAATTFALPVNPDSVQIALPSGVGQVRQTYYMTNGIHFNNYFTAQIKIKADGEGVQAAIADIPNWGWGDKLKFTNGQQSIYYYGDYTDPTTMVTPDNDKWLWQGTHANTATITEAPPFTAQLTGNLSSSISGRLTSGTYYTVSNSINFTHGSDSTKNFGASCIYNEKINSGEWKHITHGKFYSLQPPGARIDKNSIALQKYNSSRYVWEASTGDIVNVQVINNWRGSGRQMLIVEVDNLPQTTPAPQCHRDTATNGLGTVDSAGITFTSYYSAEDYLIYASNTRWRADSFENLSDDVVGYSTLRENYTTGRADVAPTNWSANDQIRMSNLNDTSDDGTTFVYSTSQLRVQDSFAIFADFTKTVSTSEAPLFTDKAWIAPDEEYMYRLKYANTSYVEETGEHIQETGIVLFDSIESYQPPIDPDTPAQASFRGHLRGIGLDMLRTQGIEPVVYYSTIRDLNVSTHTDFTEEINGEPVWTMTEYPDTLEDVGDLDSITAFAVDCSHDTNGDEYIVEPNNKIYVDVYMQAPTREEARAEGNLTIENPVAYVYNRSHSEAQMLLDNDTRQLARDASSVTTLLLHDPTIVLKAGKGLAGRKLAEGQFRFGVYEKTTGDLVASGTNDASGEITFSPITYTSDDMGTHTYIMREITDDPSCMPTSYTCDSTEYEITVEVVAAGDSVTAIAHYPTGINYSSENSPYLPPISKPDNEGLPAFINRYTSSGESINITATKEVTAEEGVTMPPVRGGEFEFTLYNEAGDAVATATNNADGTIDFGTLTFTQDDINQETSTATYTYTIKETKWEAFWHPVDPDHTETVTIELTDNGDGTITPTVSYDEDGAVFTNTYSEPPATRAATGQAPPAWLLPLLFALAGGAIAQALLTRRQRRVRK